MAKLGDEISVKGGVVPKTKSVAYVGGSFSLCDLLLCQQQTFLDNITLRCLMQFLFKASEKITLAYEQMGGNLVNVCNGSQVFVDIP